MAAWNVRHPCKHTSKLATGGCRNWAALPQAGAGARQRRLQAAPVQQPLRAGAAAHQAGCISVAANFSGHPCSDGFPLGHRSIRATCAVADAGPSNALKELGKAARVLQRQSGLGRSKIQSGTCAAGWLLESLALQVLGLLAPGDVWQFVLFVSIGD